MLLHYQFNHRLCMVHQTYILLTICKYKTSPQKSWIFCQKRGNSARKEVFGSLFRRIKKFQRKRFISGGYSMCTPNRVVKSFNDSFWKRPTLFEHIFQRDPTPTLAGESDGQLPLLPQLPSIFQRDPIPTLAGESDGNYPYYPNYRLYFRETPPHPWS